MDGNGGKMLKIITELTDEEMARLKYVRRLYWHWKGSRQLKDSGSEPITTQELSDRGIAYKEEPYIEYVKRPPHDKYLWTHSFLKYLGAWLYEAAYLKQLFPFLPDQNYA